MIDRLARIQLRFLIMEFDRIEASRDPDASPLDLTETSLYGESLGIRTAIAHMTGVYSLTTPKGGVEKWMPMLRTLVEKGE